MKPSSLDMNFAPGARVRHRIGVALLLVGGIALAAGAAAWIQAWSARADQAHTLATAHAKQAEAQVRSSRPAAMSAADLARDKAALQAARTLQTPWADLLAALEATSLANVALLAIEPSPIKQSVRLTAEARDAAAMLDYLSGLHSDLRLTQVTLLSHQVQLQSPGTPVRFQIQAGWGAQP